MESYLRPLAESPPLAGRVRRGVRVVCVGKEGLGKGDMIASPERLRRPFRLLLEERGGQESVARADMILVRPLIKRGESEDGIEVEGSMLVPELTVSAEGVAWYPAGVNVAGITDMPVSREIFSLRSSKERVIERFLEYRQLDGSLPRAYHCA